MYGDCCIIYSSNTMSKYNSKKTEYNGFIYDSKKEANYAQTLDLLKKALGKDRVAYYEQQIPYVCVVNGKKICTYKADFKVVYDDGRIEIVDVKGFKTAIYRLKKKLVEAIFCIKIIEV